VVITASEMGKRGAKGRMRNLTAEQRSEIARKAARARWAMARKRLKPALDQ
jgi:hypothetical protein